MGTVIEVTVPKKSDAEAVFKKIEELDHLLSARNPGSEVYQLNEKGLLKVSADTLAVVSAAKDFYYLTDGAFDITVLPLLELWGFSKDIKNRIKPAPKQIKTTLSLVGSDKININKNNSVITLTKKGMKIDLGGIAKGYAADEAVKMLKERGVKSALLNIGGQIYCLGKKGTKPWSVGIKDPDKTEIVEKIDSENIAISTSGNYERYIEIDGVRYLHIFDPRTGYPVNNNIVSVTVIAKSGLVADAMSTALFVAGKEKAAELADKSGILGFYFIEK
jgi:thiamine biosynthesis lipoprotein